ncbi:MAG: ABC transporter permease subunit, partial [Pseudomonadota bacterium]
VWTYQSDVPAHEGPTNHALLELWTYEFPLDVDAKARLIADLGVIRPLLAQARGNLTGDAGELFSAGIESLPKGQFEAADALGLPFPVTLWKVVLPQAVRVAIPPQTSNCVAIAKDTSLASVVAMPDLLKEAQNAQALTANPSPLIAAAILYFVILWPLVRLVSYLERRARRAEQH